jgi:hypothetical protein
MQPTRRYTARLGSLRLDLNLRQLGQIVRKTAVVTATPMPIDRHACRLRRESEYGTCRSLAGRAQQRGQYGPAGTTYTSHSPSLTFSLKARKSREAVANPISRSTWPSPLKLHHYYTQECKIQQMFEQCKTFALKSCICIAKRTRPVHHQIKPLPPTATL